MTNNDTQQALEALSTLVGADDELGQYWLQIIRQALQSQAEKDRVIDHCDLMRDEFMRIKSCQNATEEIKNLCDRALKKRHIIYNILQPTGCHYQPRRNRRASDERD